MWKILVYAFLKTNFQAVSKCIPNILVHTLISKLVSMLVYFFLNNIKWNNNFYKQKTNSIWSVEKSFKKSVMKKSWSYYDDMPLKWKLNSPIISSSAFSLYKKTQPLLVRYQLPLVRHFKIIMTTLFYMFSVCSNYYKILILFKEKRLLSSCSLNLKKNRKKVLQNYFVESVLYKMQITFKSKLKKMSYY